MIINSVTEAIGKTPLMRLSKIEASLTAGGGYLWKVGSHESGRQH